jgi:transposase
MKLVQEKGMGKFRAYRQEQGWLLPPSVKDVLGERHLCFFVHEVVERLDLEVIESGYSNEGHPGYHPKLLMKLWLYAYCLGLTSSRRLEQRTREDLGFRYLAGGAEPDFWTLNAFRTRHKLGINDAFTQVVEFAQAQGMARLGHVAIDSTRIAANASRDRLITEQRLRQERAHIRRSIRTWQKRCEQDCRQEGCGTEVEANWQPRLDTISGELKQLRRSGLKKQSATDPDSRFLKQRQGFVLGYTADIAVSEDHCIVAHRVSQQSSDHDSLNAMVDEIEARCRAVPEKVSADSGYYKTTEIQAVIDREIDVYVPDNNLACELNGGPPAESIDGCVKQHRGVLEQMRKKLRSPEGRMIYKKRRATVEPVFGVLKEQRSGRRFRLRGLASVAAEFCWMALAYNVTRLYNSNVLAAAK